MADAKTRKQRMRERRQQAGMKAELVWLSPKARAAMAALRRPGETVDAFFNRALVTLQDVRQIETSHASRPQARRGDGAGLALVALLQRLLPEGQPRYLRDLGIETLPLARLNACLAPLGYVIAAKKVRTPQRFVACIDAQGQVEWFGLFELRCLEEHDSDGAGD